MLIQSQAQRSQALNRADALAKLVALFRSRLPGAAPAKGHPPTRASQTRRLDGKAKRGAVASCASATKP